MTDQASLTEAAESFLCALITGDIGDLIGQLGANAVIDEPRIGRVADIGKQLESLKALHAWMDSWFPRLQHLRTTTTYRSACSEDILVLDIDGETVELPVCVIVAKTDEPVFRIARIYYSLWPFERHHVFRPRVFQSTVPVHAVPSDIIDKFLSSLSVGDVDAAISCCEADVYLRATGRLARSHFGTRQLRDYLSALTRKGPPVFRPEAITDDGRCAAIELSITTPAEQPSTEAAEEAALLVCERSEDRRLRAIRIYSDLETVRSG